MEYLTKLRLEKARTLKNNPEYTIDYIASECGFKSERQLQRILISALVQLSDGGRLWQGEEVKSFPFTLKCIDDKFFVDKNMSSDTTILKGTQVLEINGRTAEWIVDEMKKRMISDGYNTTAKLRYDIETAFRYHYFLHFNRNETFHLKVKRAVNILAVEGVTNAEFEERSISRYPKLKNFIYPLSLEILDSLNTAVFRLNTFLDGKNRNDLGISITNYTKHVFDQLQKHPNITNLVIDVRQNGGVNPGTEISILSYLTQQKNKVYKRVERNKRALFFKKDTSGKFYSEIVLGYSLEPKPNRFTGQVYILTSGKTYSAASIFSSSLAHFTDAIVVGEETGGGFYGTTGGSSKMVFTPNVKLKLIIPRERFLLNVSGQSEGTGLLPDHHVTQAYEDFMENRDIEIQYTFELIRSQ